MDTNGHTDPKKAAMLNALEENLCVVKDAAKKVGIARSTHYLWMAEDENYRMAVEDLGNVVLDFAENKLHALIEKGDTAATIFLLKTKGKKRGYIERTELAGVRDQPIVWQEQKTYETKYNAVSGNGNGLQTKSGIV